MSGISKPNTRAKIKTLRLILGDQLNLQHSWFRQTDSSVLYVIAELHQEMRYVKHHIQKICAFFAAMKEFSEELKRENHRVVHLTLDETAATLKLVHLIGQLMKAYDIEKFEYQRPDEFRLLQQLREVSTTYDIATSEVDTEHFMLPMEELRHYFAPNKHVRMEPFYRKMRKRFSILMDGDGPEGEQWNFDQQNRNKLNAEAIKQIPEPLRFDNDVSDIIDRLNSHEIPTFGKPSQLIAFPNNRDQALALLEFFCTHCLASFGRYQDAMTCESVHDWSLYHSRLSFALNVKILNPAEVIEHVIASYRANDEISLAQAEGFVRQIIGWREYIRAVYWINMPAYEQLNKLEAKRSLPNYFWTGDTKMNCMHHAVRNSLENAYAHHIQRLMVTGNFSLLTGIDPNQVDAWYLGIYADAVQWVELPNTRGMALHADGGLVGTKPYAASGNYINKMSDYCKNCSYSVTKKHGEDSCPFNSLYWNFMQQHRERFSKNQRMSMPYRTWDRMDPDIKTSILCTAKHYIDSIDSL